MIAQNAQNANQGSATPGQKSPLDVLEDIVKDSKRSVGGQIVDPQLAQEETAIKETVQIKKQEADLLALKEHQRIEDELQIKAKMVEMKSINQSPAAKIREKQEQDKVSQSQTLKTSQDGYQINQLQHTKI